MELCAPRHGDARIDILADGVLQKAHRRKHRDLAGSQLVLERKARICCLCAVDDTLHAAEVIHMRVAVQYGLDLQRAEAVFHQFLGGFHVFPAHQHVKHDPAMVGADKGRVGHIKAAHLIDAVAHFKQTGLGVQLRVPPQARIDGVRRIAIQIAIALQIPRRCSVIVVNDPAFLIVQQAARCIVKFLPVGKIQFAVPLRIFFCGTARRILRRPRL